MYQDVLKKDGEKCARCGGTIRGYGHNGRPLINGRVCDKCNVDVVAFRMHMINIQEALKAVSYTHLTLPTICSL